MLLSYGAPECSRDVRPFIENVLRGHNVAFDRSTVIERIDMVAERYDRLARESGSFSPLPGECRDLIALLHEEFRRTELRFPIYWGNLFWHPYLEETIAAMSRDGIRHAVAFATSAFPSVPGCRRYRDALESACRAVGPRAPTFQFIRPCCEHPLFPEAVADRMLEGLAHMELDPDFDPVVGAAKTKIVFTAHSIPETDAMLVPYTGALRAACRRVMELLRAPIGAVQSCERSHLQPHVQSYTHWELVYQSRGGKPGERWLKPDVVERLTGIKREERFANVFLVPIGFFCENMETVYDLDRLAGERCEQLGLHHVRARAVGASPKIIRMIRECVVDAVTNAGVNAGVNAGKTVCRGDCPSGCCPSG